MYAYFVVYSIDVYLCVFVCYRLLDIRLCGDRLYYNYECRQRVYTRYVMLIHVCIILPYELYSYARPNLVYYIAL